ncbi:MAG: phosphocholine cytidylyltransferase family protein, partial [Lachnospiraceae bacterium]|nr:phosphocholine cytidylyltransferase family protein [Lachnospiraceae bacterium]
IPVVKAKAKEALKEEQFLAYFETVIQKMIDDKKYDIRMVDIQDAFWAEIDFLEDYEQAVERLKEKNYEL